jgi:hypothetical protein
MQPVDKAQDRLGQRNAKAMRKALAESWSIQDVITHWTHLAPESLMTRKQVADWLRINLRFNNTGLNKTLATIYAEATVFAIDAANFRVRQAVKRNKAPLGSFDWDNWKPGNRPAALIVNPPEGLARRLEQRYRKIKDLNNTTVDRIGTILADGLSAGLGPRAVASDVAGELIDSRTDWADTLEERLKQVAQDQRRAEVIARTEMNRAVWDEKVDRYAEMGVTKVEWVVVSPCDDCAENDGAVVELGEPFPNGWTSIDDSHPNCNCTVTPVLDDLFELDIPGQGDDDLELGALADLAKYSEDQERDESGRFGSGGGGGGSSSFSPREPMTGRQILDKATSVNAKELFQKYRAEAKDMTNPNGMRHTDYQVNAFQEAMGVGGRPTLVDDASKLTGEPIYRGVVFVEQENLDKAGENLKNGEVAWQGEGVMGGGLYFGDREEVAMKYAQSESGKPFEIYTAALSPDANVVSFANPKEYITATANLAREQNEAINNALNEKYGEGNSAEKAEAEDRIRAFVPGLMSATQSEVDQAHVNWLLKGVDAVSIGRTDRYDQPTTYTVVFNREALQVVK